MQRFRIFKTESYDKDYDSLDHSEQLRVDSIVDSLFETGDFTGKPLGIPFLREKKFGGKRLIYLIYAPKSSILLVAISDKKTQQSTINEILLNLQEYELYLIKKLNDIPT